MVFENLNETNTSSNKSVSFILPVLDSVIIIIFIIIMIILTTVGNLIVFLSFIRERGLRNFSDFLILNLAISDFIIGSICIPFYVPYLLTGNWPFGHNFCLFWITADYVTPAASAINICVISLDRYIRVAHALWIRGHETKMLLAIFMLAPWVLPSAFYMIVIPFWETIQGTLIIPDNQCFIPYHDKLSLLLVGTTIEFIVPFLFVSVCNILVVVSIRKRGQVLKRMGAVHSQTHGNQSSANNTRNLRKDRKAARSLFIIVLVFGICWMPFEILALVLSVCPTCVHSLVFEISFWLLWINSTANPVLYPLLHRRYKIAFMKLFCNKGRVDPEMTINTVSIA